VMFILLMALDIHLARIPVALLGYALRAPVRPDAELGVAKPLRALVVLGERLPVGLERTGNYFAAIGFEVGRNTRW